MAKTLTLLVGLFVITSSASAQGAGDFRAALAWQIALERAGFSPGVIDGHTGWKTTYATGQFQLSRGMNATGQLDEATVSALGIDPASAITTYTVDGSDLAQLGPVPRKWVEKARLSRLGYPSLDEELAEKFHCSRNLLAVLNPGTSIAHLSAGSTINVPNLGNLTIRRGDRVEISFSHKTVRVLKADGTPVGLLHCSIAKHKEKLPSGTARVMSIVRNPTYMFDPRMYPEVKTIHQKLLIPPGPRNPVGLCWIGLNRPGYGMHGTPNAELIGKTGSHGCFRLANWDAIRLGRMVRVGTPVAFLP